MPIRLLSALLLSAVVNVAASAETIFTERDNTIIADITIENNRVIVEQSDMLGDTRKCHHRRPGHPNMEMIAKGIFNCLDDQSHAIFTNKKVSKPLAAGGFTDMRFTRLFTITVLGDEFIISYGSASEMRGVRLM